jgi:hypothetical protein
VQSCTFSQDIDASKRDRDRVEIRYVELLDQVRLAIYSRNHRHRRRRDLQIQVDKKMLGLMCERMA